MKKTLAILFVGYSCFGQLRPTLMFPTVSVLDSRRAISNEVVSVLGYTSPGDWGVPKQFRWDATNALSTNAVRRGTNAIGRWVHDIDTSIKPFATAAALRSDIFVDALPDGSIVSISGIDYAGDGGAGTFRIVSSDTTTDDNNSSVIVTDAGSRFYRVSPSWVFRAGTSSSEFAGVGEIDFQLPIDFLVYSDGTLSKSVTNFYVDRAKTYYLNPGGNDSNDGLSESSPKQSLYNLITAINAGASSNKSGGVRIVLAPGLYSGAVGFSGASIQFPSTIECTNGKAIIVSGRGGTDWSVASGTIYRRFSHTPARMFDFKFRDADGIPYEMAYDPTNYTSNSDVYTNLLRGRWTIFGGGTYFRALDDRVASTDTNTPIVSAMTNLSYLVNLRDFSDSWTNRGTAHYLKNLILVGNTNTLRSSLSTVTNAIIAIDSCEFFANQDTSQGAVYIARDSGGAWIENSLVALSWEDGIEYHGFSTSSIPFGVEVNVRSVKNGTDQSSNGSTGHESARIVRVNGTYTQNYGRAVHDVIYTKAVNLWCYAGLSTDQDDGDDVAFMNGIDGSTDYSVSWYYDCKSAGGGTNHNAFRVSGNAISYIVRGLTGQSSSFNDAGTFKFLK